jgi:hypothetical protein
MNRADVKFRAKTEAPVVVPDSLFDEAPMVEEVLVVEEVKIPKGFEELPEVSVNFPYTGRAVYVTDGVNVAPAVWRVTRSYDGANVKWVYDQYWAQHNAGGQRLDMVPIAYKKMED